MVRGRFIDRFTFGGRVPGAVGLILAFTVVSSLFVAFGSRHAGAPGSLFDLARLVPERVLHGEIWRLATWVFVEPSPLSLLFACLLLYWFGKDLADEWGSLRFLRVYGSIGFVAAAGTCLVALIDRDAYAQSYIGSWSLALAVAVAWGLYFPDRVIRIWFVLPIKGIVLAWLTVALTVVYAVYSGWEHHLPKLLAEGAMLAWLFRHSFASRLARIQRVHRAGKRDTWEKKRKASEAVLRSLEAKDDDLAPLPPEIADVLGAKNKD